MEPTFLGIGFQKCGTTWVYDNLKEHPDVYMPSHVKEVNFFDKYYSKGLKWYIEHFDGAKDAKCIGEFTPGYINENENIQRIYNDLPKVKLIIVIRNPIDRAISHYKHFMRINQKEVDFFQAIKEDTSILNAGNFSEKINYLYKFFSRDQIHIIKYDDIKDSPEKVMRDLCKFLEIKDIKTYKNLYKVSNSARVARSKTLFKFVYIVKNRLRSLGMHAIVNTLKPLLIPVFLKKANSFTVEQNVYDYLEQFYKEEGRKLREMGIDVSW